MIIRRRIIIPEVRAMILVSPVYNSIFSG